MKNKWLIDVREEKGKDGFTSFGFRKVPLEEKAGWVSRHFTSIADRYDLSNTILSLGIHHAWKRKAVRMMKLNAGARILDLCGGTGDLSLMASGYIGQNGRIILYDINRKMIGVGQRKIKHARRGHQILSVQGDAEWIAFPANTFDAAMVGFGIRNLTNIKKGLAEMHRVLKPGGTMMCLEFSRPVTPWFRFLYDFYSFSIMPFLGKILTGATQAYSYLPESIRLFPLQDDLKKILLDIGYQQVRYKNLTDGIAVVHIGTKE